MPEVRANNDDAQPAPAAAFQPAAPSVTLPKGGGAIRGIGEKFGANPVTGTGSLSVPIATSPGRSGFGPQLGLSYDSGAGNGPFGFGWSLSLPTITRKTDKGLPQYLDALESDVFILSGAEDLVPVLKPDGSVYEDTDSIVGYTIHRYRPRIEGLFARIERWTGHTTGEVHWRSVTKDNVVTLYGKDNESRIFNPSDPDPVHPTRIFSWLICESYDDRGNAVLYKYEGEDDTNIDLTQANERNRQRTANRYLKRILYGNKVSRLIQSNLASMDWMFEAVFDYDEGHFEDIDLDPTIPEAAQHRFVRATASSLPQGKTWAVRPDPFSSYRAGFEVRTYRRCRRVLMFHNFPELGDEPYLVRSTEFAYNDLDYSQPTTIESELAHPGSTRFASFISSVTQSGFVRDDTKPALEQNGVNYVTYLKKSLPPLEFEYSKPSIQDDICDLDAESLENLPIGLDGTTYQWVDLDGEGVSGILTEQADAWFYKPNLGEGRFGALERVASKPSLAAISSGRQQLLDLAGDGQLDLAAFSGPTPGFYDRTGDQDWEPFRPFAKLPNVAWDEPNLRFVDLNGDGHADILITEDEVFTWHPSLAEEGFGSAERVRTPLDEEQGPRLVLADGIQSVYLADMCGDGLTDLVRIRNGEVCYWPNCGYGRFGSKVTMAFAPWFDSPDQFNQSRIRLADIDGSGTNDIIYLGRDGVRLYFNESGNRWTEPRFLSQFPSVDNLSSVMAADLLGNGTACLAWSSPLAGDTSRPMRYIDLMGGQKPHLMIKSVNNLGAETRVQYASSTKLYLADKLAGKPWITKIPFPVHVVEEVETHDWVSGNHFLTRYAYHHGYFDGTEREFRGFGMVEQWDSAEFASLSGSLDYPVGTNIEESSHVPPVLTRTWFHTGAFIEAGKVSKQYAHEYWVEPALRADDPDSLTESESLLVPDTVIETPVPPEAPLDIGELREAYRALKGMALRIEVYAEDGSSVTEHPYTVTEQNFNVRRLQAQGRNRHAVFFSHPREAVTYHYERRLVPILNGQIVAKADAESMNAVWRSDPRIQHALTLLVDSYGNVLKSAAIGYGRRWDAPDAELLPEDREKQRLVHFTYTESSFTNPIPLDPFSNDVDAYRTPLAADTRTYEVRKPGQDKSSTAPTKLYGFDDVLTYATQAGDGNHDVDYDDIQFAKAIQIATISPAEANNYFRRLVEQVRTLYRKNNLSAFSSLGEAESLALPGESYKLAFTQGLLAQVFKRPLDMLQSPGSPPPETLLVAPSDILSGPGADRGGYVISQDLKAAGVFPGSDTDNEWWISSGRVFFSPNPNDDAMMESDYAIHHYFLPHRYRDPFHTDAVSTESSVKYDAYDLLLAETQDALGNVVTVNTSDDTGATTNRLDYRVLQPHWVTDPNQNRTAVAFDALGMVAGTAVMGKPQPAKLEGDTLDDFNPDLTQAEVDSFYDVEDPHTEAPGLLKDATTRIVYDLDRFMRTKQEHPSDPSKWLPTYASTLARETHVSDLKGGDETKIQISFSYSDGFGREIQTKIQAEPGPLVEGGPIVNPRWVGSGWTIFNNKGKRVRQYEPFFSQLTEKRHQFEFGVQVGVSPILFYDPIERVVATLHPNHTWEKVVFDPWRQETWDVNDTVSLDPKSDDAVKNYFLRLPDTEYLPTWHALRTDPMNAAEATQRWPDLDIRNAEKGAAEKAAVHGKTPSIAHFDALGRTFLTIVHNRFEQKDNGGATTVEEKYPTRVELDIEGNQRAVRDAIVQNGDPLGRIVMRYDYDMLGNRIHQASMEAGERWMLNDVAGKPVRAWDSRGHQFRTAYDPLRRPVESYLGEGGDPELQVGRTVYGETMSNPEQNNLRGKVVQLSDQAGVVTSDEYDFKGNLLKSQRQLATEYKTTLDWLASVPLEAVTYTSSTTYDALNRPLTQTRPDNSVIRQTYNEANLLNGIDANLQGALKDGQPIWTPFVINIDYNAKGQRTLIEYGNGVSTSYKYDSFTFRLALLLTRRDPSAFPDDCPSSPPVGWPGCQVQNLKYVHDPAGNITHIQDDVQQTIFFRNKRVEPSSEYKYDALYRLIEATGREHLGQTGGQLNPATSPDWSNAFHIGKDHPGDGYAMGLYTERFTYDGVGNIEKVHHVGGWTRSYAYNEPSQIEPGKTNNRLSSTTTNGTTEHYHYVGFAGLHGNMTDMPHLPLMQWDFHDQLQATSQQVNNNGMPEITYYVYDASGQRVRKITELSTGAIKDERIYLGGFEIYRKHNGSAGAVSLERETLHIMDDKRRVALVETKTADTNVPAGLLPETLIRYQFCNHLGSASLEMDDEMRIISYEEYFPYGSSSYQAVRSQSETPKRFRYTGKERDEENGLYYHGSRYYSPLLGRWPSTDKLGIADGVSLYCYAQGNPLLWKDPTGTQCEPDEEVQVCIPEEDRAKQTPSQTKNCDPSPPQASPLVFEPGANPPPPLPEVVEDPKNQNQVIMTAPTMIVTKADAQNQFVEDMALGYNPWVNNYSLPEIKDPLRLYQNPFVSAYQEVDNIQQNSSDSLEVGAGYIAKGTLLGPIFLSEIPNAPSNLHVASQLLFRSFERQYKLGDTRGALKDALKAETMAYGAVGGLQFGTAAVNELTYSGFPEVTVTDEAMVASEVTMVSRWGRPGLQQGDWVMEGPPTSTNYFLSGKWQYGLGNEHAPWAESETFLVPKSSLRAPTGYGIDGTVKSWFGQYQYRSE